MSNTGIQYLKLTVLYENDWIFDAAQMDLFDCTNSSSADFVSDRSKENRRQGAETSQLAMGPLRDSAHHAPQ